MRSYDTGDISYDPDNHQKMTNLRKAKVDGIASDIPYRKFVMVIVVAGLQWLVGAQLLVPFIRQ